MVKFKNKAEFEKYLTGLPPGAQRRFRAAFGSMIDPALNLPEKPRNRPAAPVKPFSVVVPLRPHEPTVRPSLRIRAGNAVRRAARVARRALYIAAVLAAVAAASSFATYIALDGGHRSAVCSEGD